MQDENLFSNKVIVLLTLLDMIIKVSFIFTGLSMLCLMIALLDLNAPAYITKIYIFGRALFYLLLIIASMLFMLIDHLHKKIHN